MFLFLVFAQLMFMDSIDLGVRNVPLSIIPRVKGYRKHKIADLVSLTEVNRIDYSRRPVSSLTQLLYYTACIYSGLGNELLIQVRVCMVFCGASGSGESSRRNDNDPPQYTNQALAVCGPPQQFFF
jgi:hypothetical protein